MKEFVFILSGIGFANAIYSMTNIILKVKRNGIRRYRFKFKTSRLIYDSITISLLLGAAYVMYKHDNIGWLMFFCLGINHSIDLIGNNIVFEDEKTDL